jgi:hypothetical protein
MGVYGYLTQIQSAYSQYLQIKIQLKQLDVELKRANDAFESIPTLQNLSMVNAVWNQKYRVMQQIPSISESIVGNLVLATREALSSLQLSLANRNIMSALDDTAISSICIFVEPDRNQLNLVSYYKQRCANEGILMQISDIEMKIMMSVVNLPNFNRLKKIIRGY